MTRVMKGIFVAFPSWPDWEKRKFLPAQLSVQRLGPLAQSCCRASEAQLVKAGDTIQPQMMVKDGEGTLP